MKNRNVLEMTRRGFLGTALGGAAVLAAGPAPGPGQNRHGGSPKERPTGGCGGARAQV
jgi:hypothetical protein